MEETSPQGGWQVLEHGRVGVVVGARSTGWGRSTLGFRLLGVAEVQGPMGRHLPGW